MTRRPGRSAAGRSRRVHKESPFRGGLNVRHTAGQPFFVYIRIKKQYTTCMVSIEHLRRICQNGNVFVTNHAMERCRQRGILVKDILHAVETGEIIETYPDDFPFPSCLVCGKSVEGSIIHVCMSDEGESSKIITAYKPDSDRWNEGFKSRKEVR